MIDLNNQKRVKESENDSVGLLILSVMSWVGITAMLSVLLGVFA